MLPGVEELYNGAGESKDADDDDPAAFTPVQVFAGMTVPNITIIFNRRPPGPIPLTDDGAVEIFTDFAMRFCGNSHDSVWVNGNGNLTFGAPSPTFSESAAAMLLGPPRIAGLFDDLNPEAGGAVRFDQSANALVVHFEDVPEFDPVTGGGVGANTFSIAIRRSLLDGSRGLALHGGRVTIDYGDLSATDGAAGYSCGGKVTSGFELETDFSRLRLPFVLGLDKAAVYEEFTAAENYFSGRQPLRHLHAEAVPLFVRAEQHAAERPGASERSGEAAVQHGRSPQRARRQRRGLLPLPRQRRRHLGGGNAARLAAGHDGRALRRRGQSRGAR